MALFPMFVDLNGCDCLVIGGGEVALRKIEQLVKFYPKLTVISPWIHEDIRALSREHTVQLIERGYRIDDVEGRFLVIGALDSLEEQEKIYHACMERRIPVNCVDSPAWCSFIFPALIVEKELCIGINTSGKAPAVSSYLRRYLTDLIPEGIHALIEKVHSVRQSEPAGKGRQEKIIEMCRGFFGKISIPKQQDSELT